MVISWAWDTFDKGGAVVDGDDDKTARQKTKTMIDARSKGKEQRREKTAEGEMSHMMAW
jgi:hypothetical protein